MNRISILCSRKCVFFFARSRERARICDDVILFSWTYRQQHDRTMAWHNEQLTMRVFFCLVSVFLNVVVYRKSHKEQANRTLMCKIDKHTISLYFIWRYDVDISNELNQKVKKKKNNNRETCGKERASDGLTWMLYAVYRAYRLHVTRLFHHIVRNKQQHIDNRIDLTKHT